MKQLDLSNQWFADLPDWIRREREVTHLLLSNDAPLTMIRPPGLSELPEWLAELTCLEYIDLRNNSFAVIPPVLFSLPHLETILLGNTFIFPGSANDLTEIPAAISSLRSLKVLRVESNNISTIAPSIQDLPHLQVIDLTDNNLRHLPSTFGNIASLVELNLSHNPLSVLPDTLGGLRSLKTIDLENCPIPSLPEELGHLPLEIALLSDTAVQRLPSSFRGHGTLRLLEMSGCNLTEWPENVSDLPGLEELDLSRNKLPTLPEHELRFPSLLTLYLHQNHLESFSTAHLSIPKLQTLRLSDNQLTTAGISEIRGIQELREADLAVNALSDFPRFLTESAGTIQSINLEQNIISALPDVLLDLRPDVCIELQGNPLLEPPMEIVEHGFAAIQDYLEQRREQGTDRLHEAKLLIVGDPGSGKTTLFNKLLDPAFKVPNVRDATIVPNIHQGWKFNWPHENDESVEFTVNLWDFGGQKLQYMTHQFFLTSRSLYVLVTDDRTQKTNFDYWLEIIRILGGNSPVLVLLNQINHESITSFDSSIYRERFGSMIRACHEADLSKTDGRYFHLIDQIKCAITQLSHIGASLPKQWIPIRAELQDIAKTRNYIASTEFFAICARHNIRELKQQLNLSAYFHDLGVLLHYQNDSDIADRIVLRPAWIVNAVYSMLSDPAVRDKNGVISRKWIFDKWSRDYDFSERNFLLSLMLKGRFDVCYRISDSEYVVPQLLPSRPPEFQWSAMDALRMRYEYRFMPAGLIPHLIVRLSDSVEIEDGQRLHWQKGMVLKGRGGTRAIVRQKLDGKNREVIDVNIADGLADPMKREAQRLRDAIHAQLIAIHKDHFPELEFSTSVPCSGCIQSGDPEPKYFAVDELKVLMRQRVTWNHCGRCGQQYAPIQLLEGFEMAASMDSAYVFSGPIHNVVIRGGDAEVQKPQERGRIPPQSPWASGSFYLFVFVVIVVLLGVVAKEIPPYALVIVFVAAIIVVPLIGALQLRQDERLSEKSFVDLVRLSLQQLPLLRRAGRPRVAPRE